MTLLMPNDSSVLQSLETRVGFLSGHWVPHADMRLSVDDLGFRQGVTAVERLRTYGGRLFAIDAHLARWQWSTSSLGIRPLPSLEETKDHLEELLCRNQVFVERERETGVTLFATPGTADGSGPSIGIHLNRLNHEKIEFHRQHGQAIVVTDVRQPPSASWPRSIKTRCRIHYYLADAFAAQHCPDSLGVLIDDDGSITETSSCNIAIVKQGEVLSPLSDRVLAGVTQSVIELLAWQASVSWRRTAISAEELVTAEEILLMGTDGGIWFANSVGNCAIAGATPGELYLTLRDHFDRLVGTTP